MKKVGLALSGGGIKSFSQLPVLKALDQEGVEIDYLAGTSMGSIVASLMSIGLPVDELIDVILEVEKEVKEMKIFSKDFLKILSLPRNRNKSGFVDSILFEEVMDKYFERYNIENISDVKIPLAIPAVDVITGKIIVFVSHPDQFEKIDPDWEIRSDVRLSKAIRASCSFPLVFSSCPFEDYELSDGGVRMNLPMPLLKAYHATETIAVTMHNDKEFHEFNSIVSLANRFSQLARIEQDKILLKEADIVINIPLEGVWMFEVGKGRYTMDQGAEVVRKHLDDIKEFMHNDELTDEMIDRSKSK